MQKITKCLLTMAILTVMWAAPARGADPAKKPSTQPDSKPLLGGMMFPKLSLGAKTPAAIIIEPKGEKVEEFVMKWRTDLVDAGFCVFLTKAPTSGWKAQHGAKLIKEFDKLVAKGNIGGVWAQDGKIDPNRILIVTKRNGGPTAIAIIEKHFKRVSGAIMMSVAPWVHTTESIRLWRPSKDAWSVPIWATMPVNTKGGAPSLLLWRRIAAAKPDRAPLTIDPRTELDGAEPDKSIKKWLSAISGGKKPSPGPDRQTLQETKRYQGAAKQLLSAMQLTGPADAGSNFSKTEGPMELDVTAPNTWLRVERGERKYDADEMPFVQIYLTPKPGGMLFARVSAAVWNSDANGLLDQYDRRLADGGFLSVKYSRWQAKGYSLQISSVLWPTRGKWHRWLILAATGPGKKNAPAAPMVIVMDASDTPDINKMASAMKRILPSVSAVWKGEPKKKPAPAK